MKMPFMLGNRTIHSSYNFPGSVFSSTKPHGLVVRIQEIIFAKEQITKCYANAEN